MGANAWGEAMVLGVPKILDNLWKATSATDASNAIDTSSETNTTRSTALLEDPDAMGVDKTSDVVVEEVLEEVTEEVETVMGETLDRVTKKASDEATASVPAQEFFGLHQPAPLFKVPKGANGGKVFDAQSAQPLDPFSEENPPVRAGKKRAISVITTPRKSGRERKPTHKVQDSIQIWEDETTQKILNYMHQAEKSQTIPIAEAEASIDQVRIRYQKQLARFWINVHTLPKSHPLWKIQKRLKVTRRFCSPMARRIAELELAILDNFEEIKGYCLPPEEPRVDIRLEEDRERAIKMAQSGEDIKVAVDYSSRNNHVGVGASYGLGIERYLTVGDSQRLNVYIEELYAINWAVEPLAQAMKVGFPHPVQVTILSDSQAVLKALKNPLARMGSGCYHKSLWTSTN